MASFGNNVRAKLREFLTSPSAQRKPEEDEPRPELPPDNILQQLGCFACGQIPSRRIDSWDDVLCADCEKLGKEFNQRKGIKDDR